MTMRKQIYLLMAIRVIRMFLITMPIIVIYWQSHGLRMQDIFVLQVVFSIAIVLFEIPSGYFADKYGRKTSMLLGSILGVTGFFIYWAMPSYLGFILAEIILALSSGFLSGSRDALLFETLKQNGEESHYAKYQGRIFATGNVSEAVAAICAGIIASMNSIETVLLIQWIVMLIAIPLTLMLREIPNGAEMKTPTLLKILHGNFKENKRLRFLNFYTGGISAATLTMVWFAQPYWKELEINILYFGYLWAGLNLLVALGAVVAHRLEKRLSFRTLFVGMAILPFLLYMFVGYTNVTIFAVIAIASFWLLRGVAQPIIQDYVQRECKDGERATVLSINALVSRLTFSIFSPFLGWVADVWSFQVAFATSGVIFGIISLTSFILLYKEMGKNVEMT
ncbi:MAG: MFS family permease [Acidimicrobiales bacterium]|jgi:MFS family permease